MPYVRSLTDVLSGYLDWHLSRLKLMARFTSSVLTLTTTDLSKVALALKAGPKQGSNYRRIQRFLSGYEVDFRCESGVESENQHRSSEPAEHVHEQALVGTHL